MIPPGGAPYERAVFFNLSEYIRGSFYCLEANSDVFCPRIFAIGWDRTSRGTD